ncbi:MAG: hypothetical protein R6U87_08845 [Thiohalospira sp.]
MGHLEVAASVIPLGGPDSLLRTREWLEQGGQRRHARGLDWLDLRVMDAGPAGEDNGALCDAVQAYADALENHVLDAPDNWFNFYEFWSVDGDGGGSAADARRRDGG